MLLDPLPNVKIAYSKFERVERQRLINGYVGSAMEVSASISRFTIGRRAEFEMTSNAFLTVDVARGRNLEKEHGNHSL